MKIKSGMPAFLVATALLVVGAFAACGTSSNGGSNFNGSGTSGTGGTGDDDSGAGGGPVDAWVWELGSSDTKADLVSGDACASETVTSTLQVANILFLIDRTGSMLCNPPPLQTSKDCAVTPKPADDTQPSKWQITKDALVVALQSLKDVKPTPSVGIAYFNSDGGCGFPDTPDVAVEELTASKLGAITNSLEAVNPKGDTPIVGSMMRAYDFMRQQTYAGNKFVVLLTDGSETCDPANMRRVIDTAAGAAGPGYGIRTFVLGAPGSEDARSFLSSLAYSGQTALNPDTCKRDSADPTVGDCHVDMTLDGTDFKATLQEALERIGGTVVCQIDVPKPPSGGPPVDANMVNVRFTDGKQKASYIPMDTLDCDDAKNKGWQYTDESKTKIRLCGSACTLVKSDPAGALTVELGCQTITPK